MCSVSPFTDPCSVLSIQPLLNAVHLADSDVQLSLATHFVVEALLSLHASTMLFMLSTLLMSVHNSTMSMTSRYMI